MHTEYKVINNKELMRFEISQGGDIAFLAYRFSDKDIALMHTEVPEKMEGKGVGSALAGYAFKYAAENAMPVKIYCPFVLAYLKKHPEVRNPHDENSPY